MNTNEAKKQLGEYKRKVIDLQHVKNDINQDKDKLMDVINNLKE